MTVSVTTESLIDIFWTLIIVVAVDSEDDAFSSTVSEELGEVLAVDVVS